MDREEVREIICNEKIASIIFDLLKGFPVICNSLYFERGSEQRMHFDTFYMPPKTPGKMLATWIALEDVNDLNGPLIYYPKSHKIKPYIFSNNRTIALNNEMKGFDNFINNEISKKNLKPRKLFAKAGDVFIWHSQLYHGGAKIIDDKITRKSIVTHYFEEKDCNKENITKINKFGYYLNRDHQKIKK